MSIIWQNLCLFWAVLSTFKKCHPLLGWLKIEILICVQCKVQRVSELNAVKSEALRVVPGYTRGRRGAVTFW